MPIHVISKMTFPIPPYKTIALLSAMKKAIPRRFKKLLFQVLVVVFFSHTSFTCAQTITTGAVATTQYAGNAVVVPFTATGSYLNLSSVFTVYLSDPSGSFAVKTAIGSFTYWGSLPASITATIPCTVAGGIHYRIRVECNTPLVVGSDNGSDITIFAGPRLTAGSVSASFCQGAVVGVPYTITCGPLNAGNVFTAELSDPAGNFPGTVIGTLASVTSGVITATIPPSAIPGNVYRIKIYCSSPALPEVLNSNGALTLNPVSLTAGAVALTFCQGAVVSVPYTICGGFVAGNIFRAELSDASGNFPGTIIGSVTSVTSGTINTIIPASATPGTAYRIRVTSTTPYLISSLNSSGALTLNQATITTGAVTASFCQGVGVSVPYTICGGFPAGNIFTAQLSDNNGSFASPLAIGTLTSTAAGTISATIPLSASPTATGYRIRVICSATAANSIPNTNGVLTLNPISITPGSIVTSTCQGSQRTFHNMRSLYYRKCVFCRDI
jgi:hypothetical protein